MPAGWVAVNRRRPHHHRSAGHGETLGYYTSAGPAYGPLRYCDVVGAIGVLEDLGQPLSAGMASCIGENAAGVAVWKLSIRGRDMLGRWIVFHRRFMPAE